ncbi:MAG: ATP-binding protein, partial [Actinobacteria bacterium]|nr:ATP-binding protein [Actinomycetota bacterium]
NMYYKREISKIINSALKDMPVVVLTGMRQSGKSTLLTKDTVLSNRDYLNLDNFTTLSAMERDPDSNLDTGKRITIDEAQRSPGLFLAVKRAVDRARKPGMFVLSGSANPALLKGTSESLAGRAIYFELFPMNRREIKKSTGTTPFLIEFLKRPSLPKEKAAQIKDGEVLKGGLPPVALGEVKKPALWFTGYEQTYIERDIRDLSVIENVLGFRDLIKLAALRTGQILNIASIARDAKLEAKTAARYLGWMEATYVICRLQPYLRSKASRIKKSPKIYFSDSGFACHLAGCSDLVDDPLRGSLYENYVYQNIASIVVNSIPAGQIFYWQTQAGKEVDLIIERGRDLIAIEVKSAESWGGRDLAGLNEFLSVTPNCKAAVLAYNGRESAKLGDRLWAIPLGAFLS